MVVGTITILALVCLASFICRCSNPTTSERFRSTAAGEAVAGDNNSGCTCGVCVQRCLSLPVPWLCLSTEACPKVCQMTHTATHCAKPLRTRFEHIQMPSNLRGRPTRSRNARCITKTTCCTWSELLHTPSIDAYQGQEDSLHPLCDLHVRAAYQRCCWGDSGGAYSRLNSVQ